MKRPIPRLLLALTLLLPMLASAQEYRVIKTLPASRTADVLVSDSPHRRLYAGREGALDIYDLDSGALSASIPVTGKIGGIALDTARGLAHVSLPGSHQIVTLDLKTSTALRSARSHGQEPRELVLDTASNRLYVSHAGDGVLAALDAGTGRRVGTLALGGKLRGLSLDGRGKVFIADEANDVLHVVDLAQFRSLGKIPVWPGHAPTAIANDTRERRMYVATGNSRMIVMDPDSGQMLSTINTQGTGAAGIAMEYAPARLVRLYLPNTDGKLDMVQNAKLTPSLQTTLTQSGITTATAFDDKTKQVLIASGNGIMVIGK